MEKMLPIGLAMIFMVLAMVPIVHSTHSKEITLYGLVISDGPNANVIPVAGNPGQPLNTTKFGTVFVFNVRLTKDINPNSPSVVQSQGIEVISSMDGKRGYFSSSIHFVDGEYEGSTLELQGTLAAAGVGFLGELSVVGGTGSLRSVSGYAWQSTFIPVTGTNNTINKLEIFLRSDHHI